MKPKPNQDRTLLLATATAVAERLKLRSEGTRLRIRIPSRTPLTNTGGRNAIIGDLGENQPQLEVWLDRFTGYPERKLWACFSSRHSRPPIIAITRHVSRTLWPIRTLTLKDISNDYVFALADRLGRSEFNAPVLEKYGAGETYYGIYDLTRKTGERVNPHFCTRAAAFFEDVARALPDATAEDEQREVYPRFEKRKLVASHMQRERSRLLATECKIRDKYECQVCGFHFKNAYGKLGIEYAEAHHCVPLRQVRENVRTRIEDLTTVCANCHSMLHHRMEGNRKDIHALRAIVRRRLSANG